MVAPLAQVPNDGRRRPVVFQTCAEAGQRAERRRPLRVLMWITIALVLAVASAGLAFGGSAVWSLLVPKPASPAPLWIEPPTIALHRVAPAPGPTATTSVVPTNAVPRSALVGGSSVSGRVPLTQDSYRQGGAGSGSRDGGGRSSHDG
jgi:hypothetical protein